MTKYFLPIAFLVSAIGMTSCKDSNPKTATIVEAMNTDNSPEEEVQKDLLNVLTDEKDLLINEGSEQVMKSLIPTFNRINAFTEWAQISTVDFTTGTGEGVTKLYYNKELQVEKIVVRKYEKEQQSLDVYYLNEGRVALVIKQLLVYNVDVKDKAFSIEESEYTKDCNYFARGKLISIMSNQDCGAPFAHDYLVEVDKEIKEEVKKLIP
ncbi:hypothetical protein LNQ81_02180 [Myroides sp. M-43]|uniref:hypothetical protein n=1 Tax=Myroides oncorhynchi TaxID=2893756 RepID=UPI001E3C0D4B|nr:hypothetical protein [Myroides oncorhynchi]MCC9041524.1 hypothetical protein [Myroides oncorhynchi]